mgnify:FL=1
MNDNRSDRLQEWVYGDDVIDDDMDDVDMVWNNDDRYDGDIGLGNLSMAIMMMLINMLMQSMT